MVSFLSFQDTDVLAQGFSLKNPSSELLSFPSSHCYITRGQDLNSHRPCWLLSLTWLHKEMRHFSFYFYFAFFIIFYFYYDCFFFLLPVSALIVTRKSTEKHLRKAEPQRKSHSYYGNRQGEKEELIYSLVPSWRIGHESAIMSYWT